MKGTNNLPAQFLMYSRVLVRLVPSNVWAVNLLAKYPDDADEEDEVHLRAEEPVCKP